MDSRNELNCPSEEVVPGNESVVHLPLRVHSLCQEYIGERYKIPGTETYVVYHDTGHVDSVTALCEAYVQAVRAEINERNLNFPDVNSDPLGLFEEARMFTYQSPRFNDRDIVEAVSFTFPTAARIHDLGNVAMVVNWDEFKKNQSGYSPASEFRGGLGYKGRDPEESSIQFYQDYLETFHSDLGLVEQVLKLSKRFGKTLIHNTRVAEGFKGQFKQLAFIDQVAALLAPSGCRNVWGLINEWGYHLNHQPLQSNSPNATDFMEMEDPHFMFAGYIPFTIDRFEKEQYQGLTRDIFHIITRYHHQHPDEFASLFGIPSQFASEVWPDLLRLGEDRQKLRGQIASFFWKKSPSGVHNEGINLKSFYQSIIPEFRQFIIASSNLYEARFWDPTLSLDDFTQLYKDIFGTAPNTEDV